MSKKNGADFIKWFGPLLDALRDLGDSGKPREVSEPGERPKTVYEVDLNYFKSFME